MPTSTPPPYFPQNALSPPSEARYRRFKIAVFVFLGLLLLLLSGIIVGAVYLIRWLL
jgi:hypothetical protein